MPKLIKNRKLTADTWTRIADDAPVPASGDALVSLKTWKARRDELLARDGRIGVWLGPADEPEQLVTDFAVLSLIAVEFPAFTDGRGYSTARLLRERYGYTGELRATGDVLRDNVFYLSRVGFDAIAVRDDQDADESIAALGDFSEAYQVSVERPSPLFRRRAA